jgi:hypothetical protein
MGPFATDTAVQPVGPGRYQARLDERWSSLVGIHGGYSAAIVARAIEAEVDDPDRALRTIAVQFASAPGPGPAEVEVHVERAGRSITTTSARLLQEGRVLLVVHAVSSPSWPGMSYDDLVPVRGGDPGDQPMFVPHIGIRHFDNAEVRMDPDVVPFGGGPEAWIAGWVRPLDGEAIDSAWLVAMCDILPPAVFSRTTGPVRAATIEYVVHLADAKPELAAGDHAYLSSRSSFSNDGFAVEDGTMWGPDGRVLALARQTRLAGA